MAPDFLLIITHDDIYDLYSIYALNEKGYIKWSDTSFWSGDETPEKTRRQQCFSKHCIDLDDLQGLKIQVINS